MTQLAPPWRHRISPGAALLVGAILLTALNMRTAVTTIGPLLSELRTALGMSSTVAGLLTTLPVLCFATFGAAAPAAGRRIGHDGTLAAALAITTAGLAGRAAAPGPVAFLVLSVLALAAGAVGNVLLPAVVKHHFPHRTGLVLGAYTATMAVGQTLGAALAVPIARAAGAGGWRLGVGVWALLAAVAVLAWVPRLRAGRDTAAENEQLPARRIVTSPTAWALVVMFGAQSAQAYIAFGWYAEFFRDAGLSAARAGLLVAVISVLAIPMSLLVPTLASRMRGQRPVVAVLATAMVGAYLLMITAPTTAAWAAAVLAGIGLAQFPLVLTMITLRSRVAATTGTLSAFTQGIGYLIAGSGPLLVGVLRGVTGGWGWPFVLMLSLLGILVGAGWFAARDRYVDDELATRAARRGRSA